MTLAAARDDRSSVLVVFVSDVAFREHSVLRRRHGRAAHAIAPQDLIKDCSVDRVGTGEVHLRGLGSALALEGVGLIDQSVIPIAPVRRVWGLIACT